jgi:hypothetical protein
MRALFFLLTLLVPALTAEARIKCTKVTNPSGETVTRCVESEAAPGDPARAPASEGPRALIKEINQRLAERVHRRPSIVASKEESCGLMAAAITEEREDRKALLGAEISLVQERIEEAQRLVKQAGRDEKLAKDASQKADEAVREFCLIYFRALRALEASKEKFSTAGECGAHSKPETLKAIEEILRDYEILHGRKYRCGS